MDHPYRTPPDVASDLVTGPPKSSASWRRWRAAAFGLALTLGGASGCAALNQALPFITDALLYTEDAAQILDMIDAHVRSYLAANPNPDFEAKYAVAMKASRQALTIALRSVKGAQELSQEKASQAFAEWDKAWADLQALLSGASLMGPDGNLLGAGGEKINVPEPLLSTRPR